MQVVYLNTNGFSGIGEKHSRDEINKTKAERVLDNIFDISNPDILFLSEFDVNSDAGNFVFEYLANMDYYRVYPNCWNYISKDSDYCSIVMAFTKERKKSELSPNKWLKWNEVRINDYRIIGVHIPDSNKEKERAEDFWNCLLNHYQEYGNIDKVLYIGDMNVFSEETEGKIILNSILESARDGWLEIGHSNNQQEDFTFIGKTRTDYAILSAKMPQLSKMENHKEFYENGWSDHSVIVIQF